MKGRTALEHIPYARFLGVTLEDGDDGPVCLLPFRDDLVGNAALPAVHGGVVGAFLELAALVGLIDQTDSERVPRPHRLVDINSGSQQAKDHVAPTFAHREQ